MSHKVVFKNRAGQTFTEVYATKEKACWRAEELKETKQFVSIDIQLVSG